MALTGSGRNLVQIARFSIRRLLRALSDCFDRRTSAISAAILSKGDRLSISEGLKEFYGDNRTDKKGNPGYGYLK